ncbi:unnamed protein product [Ceratitis capitata]|uniref:(Mediterranean fruit fly) hypothetical protein n=1 Tax=Ceratitis capitata TaxID=7213 RepID=A0A811UC13_CERCA|nr:unnamed protein product [Ceratitis capitata]
MGLQATAATKRKHEITFDAKDANTYTNSPPPIKAGKWSINNNNYIEAIEEQQLSGSIIKDANTNLRTLTNVSMETTQANSSSIKTNSNNSNNSSSSKGVHSSINNDKM